MYEEILEKANFGGCFGKMATVPTEKE